MNTKPFQCMNCYHKSSKKSHLVRHMMNKHELSRIICDMYMEKYIGITDGYKYKIPKIPKIIKSCEESPGIYCILAGSCICNHRIIL